MHHPTGSGKPFNTLNVGENTWLSGRHLDPFLLCLHSRTSGCASKKRKEKTFTTSIRRSKSACQSPQSGFDKGFAKGSKNGAHDKNGKQEALKLASLRKQRSSSQDIQTRLISERNADSDHNRICHSTAIISLTLKRHDKSMCTRMWNEHTHTLWIGVKTGVESWGLGADEAQREKVLGI